MEKPVYGGNQPGPDRISLLETPEEGLGVRLKLFENAKRTLDVVCHTIHAGESTDAFFEGILRAADRGVSVRILLDGKASVLWPAVNRKIRALHAHPGIECRRYNPVHPLKPWKWHFLMHDKFIVVDGRYLLLGGRNIGDKFFAPEDYAGKFSNDRDVLVLQCAARGGCAPSAAGQAAAYFEALWSYPDTKRVRGGYPEGRRNAEYAAMRASAGRFERAHPNYYRRTMQDYADMTMPTRRITLLHNPVGTRRKAPWIFETLCAVAREAQGSVMLQSPYVTANRFILSALSRIADRVSLTLLTNSAASTPNFPAYSNYFTQRRKFLKTGADIYEFQSRHSIHGKAVVIDGRLGMLGSFNMDDRSMHLDTEIMLAVDSEPFAQSLEGAIRTIQAQSLRVGTENAYVIPEGKTKASVPRMKTPALRVVAVFSMALRVFI